MLIKNEFPILEYDSDRDSLVSPSRHAIPELPERVVFAFLGDEIDRFAREHGCDVITYFETVTKMFPIYRVNYNGTELALCHAPWTAAAAVHVLDFLIGHGAKRIVACGSCGALVPFAESKVLLPTEALRCEGASYHYLPPSRTVKLNEDAVSSIEKTLSELGVPSQRVKTWTTDGFFRQTKAMADSRREEGFDVIDMECAALAACAEFRGVKFGQILFTADSLAEDAADEHDSGKFPRSSVLRLSFEAALRF